MESTKSPRHRGLLVFVSVGLRKLVERESDDIIQWRVMILPVMCRHLQIGFIAALLSDHLAAVLLRLCWRPSQRTAPAGRLPCGNCLVDVVVGGYSLPR